MTHKSSQLSRILATCVHVMLVCGVSLSVLCNAQPPDDEFLYDTFPEGFMWGTSTSAYQIEGGWDADGKGENIWDRWCHTSGRVRENHTGDVACDSYNLYQQDIEMLSNLRVHFYRFSLSWSRILPQGTTDNINEAGVEYYNRLIDGLLEAGITPMVTLYHWDLPQALQDRGGFENSDIITHFNNYARLCYQIFGDRVKWWLTFNEPWVVSWLGYGVNVFAPGVYGPDITTYIVTHNIIKAHATAWHTYDREFRPTQNGKISITLDIDWKEPLDSQQTNIDAANRAVEFKLGWFANAILVNGDYPQVMKDSVLRKSLEEGRNTSRLPEFTLAEKMRNLRTFDYLGINHYSSVLVSHHDTGVSSPSWENDRDVMETYDPNWPTSGSDWLRLVPWGLRKLLNWIKDRYDNPAVIITENGVSDPPEEFGSLNDNLRISFYREYTNNVLKAIKLDGCNVIGYTAWSAMDNFEWNEGYTATFGFHQINFTDPARRRVPKDSVSHFRQIITDNGWPNPPIN